MFKSQLLRAISLFTATFLALAGCTSAARAADNTAPTAADKPEWQWHDARDLQLEGKGWPADSREYLRLPTRAEQTAPEAVWKLAHHTAGLCVRFVTDSQRIAATWDGGGAMNHMAATGNSGLDLYRRTTAGWEFCGVGKPGTSKTTVTLASNLKRESTEYLLYLPLYHAVTELQIGVTPEATITPAPKRSTRPIVFYGTSITQGGCASRAGMCHPAILGRHFDREVINLGFSGSGKMEPAMADLLCELDPALYVLECLPNMTTEMVRERVVPFVQQLRSVHPSTPILLVENPIKPQTNPGNAALRDAFNTLGNAGIENLHYLPGDAQLAGRENGTVDGVHPTDLGFDRMATAYEPVLHAILDDARRGEATPAAAAAAPDLWPGFERSPYFNEQICEYKFDPDARVLINAAGTFDPHKPTRLVLYALPNGNTIEQTIGAQQREGRDWHFYIQHIGAQTRRLREIIPTENIVVAYLEADMRSWPTWRRRNENSGALLVQLIESVKSHIPADVTVDLTAHSGGGSLIFGYISHVDEIPAWISRIVTLDANYAYSDDEHHGDKLLAWLNKSPDHYLGVVAYDDRRIEVNGKRVVSPTGGTFRATGRMLARLSQDLTFTETKTDAYTRNRALDGRVDIIVVDNPDDKILHTVLVEKNGFLHAETFATPNENQAGEFWGPAAYTEWIQPD